MCGVPLLATPRLRMYAAPMIVTSVHARLSSKLSEIAAEINKIALSSNIAQNSVVSRAQRDSSCAPATSSPARSMRVPASTEVAMSIVPPPLVHARGNCGPKFLSLSGMSETSRASTRRADFAGLPLRDILRLAELVDHQVARPLFDDFLDLGAHVSRNDYETVRLGVNGVVVRDRQGDHAATPPPPALAENFDRLIASGARLLIDLLNLAVGRSKHRFVLGDPVVSLVHSARGWP